MTINRTTLLDLPLPVTGTESGTWGDITNNGLSQYVDIAVAGMNALTGSDFTAGALTLSNSQGDSGGTNIAAGSAQYATIKVSSLAANSTITAPASNRSYRIVNLDSTYNLTIKASGQTGITFLPGQTGLVAFTGTDYEVVGVVNAASSTDNAVPKFDGTTGQIIQNTGVTIDDSNNVSGVAQLNATTVDATNIEVTNIKAKDGTTAGSIANSTGIVTFASTVLTTTDINGGSIDGVTLGTNSPVTNAQIDNININGNTIISTNTDGNIDLTPNGTGEVNISKVDIDAGSIDGTTIGGSTPAAGTFTTITADNIIAPNVATIGQFSWDNSATTTPVAKPVVTPSADLLASIQGRMRGCLLLNNGQVNYYLNATDWTEKEDGSASVLTGADGMVMVEVPAFYVKNGSTGTLWKPIISATPLSGYDLHPAFIKDGEQVPYRYYSAYDACVDKTQAITGATAANPVVITSNNHGLQTGGTCFISGVVGMTEINDRTFTVTRVNANTFSLDGEDGTLHTPYVSGGTFAAYISGGNLDNATALVDLTATTGSKLASVSGVYPMVGLTRGEFRTLAKNRGAGWRMGDFTLWSAIGILLAVEAQTLNSQGVYGAGNTGSNYSIGSSGDQPDSPHTIAGAGNALGNGSTDTTSGAAVNAKPGTSFCKYRGIENFWGNCFDWTDGINLYSQGNSAGNKVFAYWSNTESNFADVANAAASTAIPTGFAYLGEIANTLNNNRFGTEFAPTTVWALVTTDFSSTSSHGTTDFYRTNSGWRVLRVGGVAAAGGDAGAFAFNGDSDSTNRSRLVGARLAF